MGVLEDKVAILTGGAGGIGSATATRLAEEGAAVVVADIDEAGAARVADRVTHDGGRAVAVRCDLADPDDIRALVEAAVDAYGGVDLIDHNAGWSDPRLDGDAGNVDLDVWDRVMHVNARAGLLLVRHAVGSMRERGAGAIVSISSGSSLIGEPVRVAYGMAKAAVNQLTRHLAVRYGPDGIRANAIAPGFVETDIAMRLIPDRIQARLAERTPTGRNARPVDIANVAVFLLSDAAAHVNGQLITVDGGLSVAPPV